MKIIKIYLLLVAVKILVSLFVNAPMGFADSYLYVKMARSIFFDNTFFFDNVQYTLYPPLYAIIIALAYLFSSMKLAFLTIKIINAFVISSSIFPIWLIAKDFLTKKRAIIAAVFASLVVPFMAFPAYPLSENLFYPLVLFQLYFTYKAVTTMHWKWHLLAGLFLGISFLARINGFVLLLPYGLLMLIIIIRERRLFLKQSMAFLIPMIILVGSWFLRNALLFGFSLQGILGIYAVEVPGVGHTTTLFSQLYWIFLYCAYAIFATGIIFLPLALQSLFYAKNKLRLFLSVSLLALAGFVILAGIHSGAFPNWKDSRPIGRYIAQVFPLIILAGFILAEKGCIKNFNLKWSVPTLLALFLALPLVSFVLLPLNNMSLVFLGVLTYLNFGFLAKILFVLLASSLLFLRYLNWKKILFILFVFFVIINALNFAVIIYSSHTIWEIKDESKMGVWIDENLNPSDIIGIPKEEHLFCEVGKDKISSALYVAMWFTNKVICLKNNEYYDYLLTQNAKPLEEVASFGGFYLYKPSPS